MRILFVGDIDGSPGRTALANALPALREEWQGFDFVVVNCENAAAGKGMTGKILEEFLALGVDGMTSGNHIWDKNAFYPILDEETRVLRPANLSFSVNPMTRNDTARRMPKNIIQFIDRSLRKCRIRKVLISPSFSTFRG